MITVRDVLERPVFRDAMLIAGRNGLHRAVHWVHVGEIPNLSQFLQGHELVLTTGVGLIGVDARTQFIHGLIDANAAGLVVELGQYWSRVPDDVRDIADNASFPIIAFGHAVRFLDLSREIDAMVISQHHRVLDDVEALSLNIRRALLNTDGPSRLVELLYHSIERPVLYRPRDSDDDVSFGVWDEIPPVPLDIALHPMQGHHYIRQTVMVFGAPFADLYVVHSETSIDERIYLALDRTVAALAQDAIRIASLDRSRRREEAALLSHLLFEENPEPALCRRFRNRHRLTVHAAYRVLVFESTRHGTGEWVRSQLPSGLNWVPFYESDRTIVVVSGNRPVIRNLPDLAERSRKDFVIGVSGPYDDPSTMHSALLEATEAATVATFLAKPSARYDTLGIWRWILFTPPHHLRRLLITPELGPLLDHPDAPRLLDTLEAIFAHIDSKMAASQALGIHRQTLYTRIRLIAELLGEDFLTSPRRIAFETAVMAHRYLTQQRRESR